MRWMLTISWLVGTAVTSAAADERPADALARDAVARNEQTRSRLKLAVEVAVKRDTPQVTQAYTARLKYKGTWRFADWMQPVPPGRPGDLRRQHVRAVWNDAYLAFTEGGWRFERVPVRVGRRARVDEDRADVGGSSNPARRDRVRLRQRPTVTAGVG